MRKVTGSNPVELKFLSFQTEQKTKMLLFYKARKSLNLHNLTKKVLHNFITQWYLNIKHNSKLIIFFVNYPILNNRAMIFSKKGGPSYIYYLFPYSSFDFVAAFWLENHPSLAYQISRISQWEATENLADKRELSQECWQRRPNKTEAATNAAEQPLSSPS